jgi:hypothetical protein
MRAIIDKETYQKAQQLIKDHVEVIFNVVFSVVNGETVYNNLMHYCNYKSQSYLVS